MRLSWLDLLRSAAILGMVAYHVAFDLDVYYDWNLGVTTGGWKLFQIAIASTFLAVSGISAGFWTRSEDAALKGWQRGWKILSAAMLVSLVTAVVDPATWVRFGILHCIGVAAFFLAPLRRWVHPAGIALLGILAIAATPLVPPPTFASVDWVPPAPWFGPLLLGFALGIPLSRRAPNPAAPSRLFNPLAWPGRHSLAIYLLHQPVILAVLWLLLAR